MPYRRPKKQDHILLEDSGRRFRIACARLLSRPESWYSNWFGRRGLVKACVLETAYSVYDNFGQLGSLITDENLDMYSARYDFLAAAQEALRGNEIKLDEDWEDLETCVKSLSVRAR